MTKRHVVFRGYSCWGSWGQTRRLWAHLIASFLATSLLVTLSKVRGFRESRLCVGFVLSAYPSKLAWIRLPGTRWYKNKGKAFASCFSSPSFVQVSRWFEPKWHAECEPRDTKFWRFATIYPNTHTPIQFVDALVHRSLVFRFFFFLFLRVCSRLFFFFFFFKKDFPGYAERLAQTPNVLKWTTDVVSGCRVPLPFLFSNARAA